MKSLVIGIDPGINGAIAFIEMDENDVLNTTFISTPSIQRVNAKGKVIACPELVRLIKTTLKSYPDNSSLPKRAFLESVHSMPGQGISSSFSFGKSVGVVEGIFAALEIPVTLVTPQKWKKFFDLINTEKDDARQYVITNYPKLTDQLTLKKHVDKADAFLIAMYGAISND